MSPPPHLPAQKRWGEAGDPHFQPQTKNWRLIDKVSEPKLIGAQPSGLPVEAAVQFCDFCGDTVYRTLLVRIGDGTEYRTRGFGQLKRAGSYRKACPRCAEKFRAQLREAEFIESMARQVESLVRQGASQGEIDEYIDGYGLDRGLVKGFGLPEVDTGRFR